MENAVCAQCPREELYGRLSTYLTLILGGAVATGIYEIWKCLRPPITSAVFAYVSWKVNSDVWSMKSRLMMQGDKTS